MDVLIIWVGVFTAIGFWITLIGSTVCLVGKVLNPEEVRFKRAVFALSKTFFYPLLVLILLLVVKGVA